MTDITADELRMLILAKLVEASKLGAEPENMIAAIDRIAELNQELKARRKTN